jgi:hypothetical protein
LTEEVLLVAWLAAEVIGRGRGALNLEAELRREFGRAGDTFHW